MFIACGNKSKEEEELASVDTPNSSYPMAVNDTHKESEAALFTRLTIRFGGNPLSSFLARRVIAMARLVTARGGGKERHAQVF
jgi:hypothetical protein